MNGQGGATGQTPIGDGGGGQGICRCSCGRCGGGGTAGTTNGVWYRYELLVIDPDDPTTWPPHT